MTTTCYQCSPDVTGSERALDCCNNGPFDAMTAADWAGVMGGVAILALLVLAVVLYVRALP